MILSCQNISKSFGTTEVLKNASFHIEAHEKAALIGINGAGKSTMLKIIMHRMSADEGDVVLAKDATIGYLAQHQDIIGEQTIYEEVLSARRNLVEMESKIRTLELQMKSASSEKLEKLMADYTRLNQSFEMQNGYAYRSEVTGVLKGLGFEETEFSKLVSTLSGGQKTRVALGKLLITKPDIILLDEPTNHLDMESINWLETYLINYQGAVVIVSHDRYLKHYLNQQREIKHQEDVITKLKSFNREKSIKRAESREKMLDKIDRLDKPVEVKSDMRIELTPRIASGNDVLHVEHLSKSFGSQTLFTDLNFDIKRKERVALIGNNGTGKTTILKILNQIIPPDTGKFTLGSKVQIGYYDQEHHVLHYEKTVFEEISDAYPGLNNTKIRNVLAAFLFTGDDVLKPIKSLSGGERGRVSLAKLMLSEANFLILDEPTNHLDIVSKEILENALSSYTGTVLFVSHDRYFINQTATRILDLMNGQLVNYIGNYDYYREKKDILTKAYAPKSSEDVPLASSDANSKTDWKRQKQEQAEQRKLENAIKKCENRIEELESKDDEIDKEIILPEVSTDVARCIELSEEKADIADELEKLYDSWEKLSEKKEKR